MARGWEPPWPLHVGSGRSAPFRGLRGPGPLSAQRMHAACKSEALATSTALHASFLERPWAWVPASARRDDGRLQPSRFAPWRCLFAWSGQRGLAVRRSHGKRDLARITPASFSPPSMAWSLKGWPGRGHSRAKSGSTRIRFATFCSTVHADPTIPSDESSADGLLRLEALERLAGWVPKCKEISCGDSWRQEPWIELMSLRPAASWAGWLASRLVRGCCACALRQPRNTDSTLPQLDKGGREL